MKYSKIWGVTEKIFAQNNVEIHRIEIDNGGYCSKHLHEGKYNVFYVETGEIEIHIFHDNGIVDKTTLIGGDMSSVPPNVKHMFIANTNTVAYEIYYSELKSDDIVRFTVGGMKES